jgi:protein TonB
MRMVLEIPLTEEVPTGEPLRRQVHQIMPHQKQTVVKPAVKPVEKLPPRPEERPVAKVVEIPKPVPSELVKTVEPVQPQMETKPVIAETAPQSEPQAAPVPEPVKTPSLLMNGAKTGSETSSASASTVVKPAVSAAYLETVYQKIEKCKRYPRLARYRGIEGEALLEFVLARDGKLMDTRVLRSSGYAILDREALLTVRRAKPFPKLPEGTRAGQVALKVAISFAIKN